MKILLDTNILIHREANSAVPEKLQKLFQLLSKHHVELFVHPVSFRELTYNKDPLSREITCSKALAYQTLPSPPDYLDDDHFGSLIGTINSDNDQNDCQILYSLFRNAVNFLITEDKRLIARSRRVGLVHLVLSIQDANDHFRKVLNDPDISTPPNIIEETPYNINTNDEFFDSLKEDYADFDSWWAKISREHRKIWCYKYNNKIGALLVLKDEDEFINSTPSLKKERRLKICTLKVASNGNKIGEAFIKAAVDFAIGKSINCIYITCFSEKQVALVSLLENFGFYKAAEFDSKEAIYIKHLEPESITEYNSDMDKKYYPSIFFNPPKNYHIIPIQPNFHDRLFANYRFRSQQYSLLESSGYIFSEGNTIIKAYISHSRTKKISSGDLIAFYRSHDHKKITSIGSVVDVRRDLQNPDELSRQIGSRTVYNIEEMSKICKKHNILIIFRHHFYLDKPISLTTLKKQNILKSAPQSISSITHEHFKYICITGGIHERYIVDQT